MAKSVSTERIWRNQVFKLVLELVTLASEKRNGTSSKNEMVFVVAKDINMAAVVCGGQRRTEEDYLALNVHSFCGINQFK